jgi:hypothetical protein
MKLVFATALAVCSLLAGGCATKSLSVQPQTAPGQRGVVYGLPKTLLKVTVPYTVVKKTVVSDGITTHEQPIVDVRKPIRIDPVYVVDPANLFVLDGKDLWDSMWLDSSTKVTLSSGLLLTGVEADSTDKGPEVAESLVSSALTIAKLAAAAGEVKAEPVTSIQTRLAAIAKEIGAEAQRLGAADQGVRDAAKNHIQDLIAERTQLLDIVKAYEASASETVETTEVDYVIVLDPSDADTFKPVKDKEQLVSQHQIAPPESLFGVGHVSPTPVFIKVYKGQTAIAEAGNRVLVPAGNGVLYRPAVPVRVSATVGGATALDGYLPMSQFGQAAILDAKYKAWAHMKTTAKFDSTSGGMTEYGVDASSSAERAAKLLDNSATKLSSTLAAIQEAQAKAATAAAAKPDAEIAAQQKLLQAQYDLDKLKIEYEKWKKDNGVK